MFDTDPAAAVQAYAPEAGDTSPVAWVGEDLAFADDPVVLPEGVYAGFSEVYGWTWGEAGERITVSWVPEDDTPYGGLSVVAPTVAEESDDGLTWVGVAQTSGWIRIYASTEAFTSDTLAVVIHSEAAAAERTWYGDADGDGFGDPTAPLVAATRPAGATDGAEDCNDAVATVFPGAAEVCLDGVDTDCDGVDPACATIGEDLLPTSHPQYCGGSGMNLGAAVPVGDLDGDGVAEIGLVTDAGWTFVPVGTTDVCADNLSPGVDLSFRVLGDDVGDGRASLLVEEDDALWLVRGTPSLPVSANGIPVPGSFNAVESTYSDLTGDGLPELATWNEPDLDAVSAWEAPFSAGDPPIATWTGVSQTFREVADLDGDGLGEVAMTSGADLLLAFGPHTGTVAFSAVASTVGQGYPLATGDADGDGVEDLVVLSDERTFHLLTDATPAGATDFGQVTLEPAVFLGIRSVAVLDGDLWIAANGLFQAEGPLAGVQPAPLRRDGVLGATTLAAAQLDGQGGLDLLVHAQGWDQGAAWILFGP